MDYESNKYLLFSRLPLLQGISSTELLAWEDALRLEPDELPPSGLPLIRQGEPCSSLICLIGGELEKEHHSPDGIYATRCLLKAPAVVEVDRLFGLTPTYEHSYRAVTDVKMLSIRKSALSSHLMKSEVFRLNLLNMLSALAQKRAAALRPLQPESPEERLRLFLRNLFPDCEGKAEVIIQMKDLAHFIGHSRLITSQVLNRLADEGFIRLGRGHFTVFDIEKVKR